MEEKLSKYDELVRYNEKISMTLEEYKDIIKIYLKDITGKDEKDITEEDIKEGFASIVYISGISSPNISNKRSLVENFLSLNKDNIKQEITKNTYLRDVLNNKFGIKKDYDFEGRIGDHNLLNSLDLSIEDISIIAQKDILPEQFEMVSEKYIKDILQVIKRNPNLNLYFIYDDVHDSNDEKLIENYRDFLNGKTSLNFQNKIILKEMINLLSTYSMKELLNKDERAKKELNSGLYDYIKMPDPKFSPKEREKINNITDIWEKGDIANYKNLRLLFKRYSDIYRNGNIKDDKLISNIQEIKYALENGVPEKEGAKALKDNMQNWYNYYEKSNKKDIVKSIFMPSTNGSIKSRKDMPNSFLLHFYNPNGPMDMAFKLTAINRCRVANGEEPIVINNVRDLFFNEYIINKVKEEQERFSSYIKEEKIDDCVNELIPSKVFKFKDTDIKLPRQEVFEATEKQLACYLINGESLLNLSDNEKNFFSGNGNVAFAVGFSQNNLDPENIMLSCTQNANSNVGIDNIPCEDKFVELQKDYTEISKVQNKRTEILLKRENVKSDYLLILKSNEIDKQEEELIEKQIEEAEKLNLKVITIDMPEIKKNDKELFDEQEEIIR